MLHLPRTYFKRLLYQGLTFVVVTNCLTLSIYPQSQTESSDATVKAHSPNLIGGQPVSASSLNKSDQPTRARMKEAFGNTRMGFEANRGQTDPRVEFFSRAKGHSLFLTANEAVLTLPKVKTGGGRTKQRVTVHRPLLLPLRTLRIGEL